MLRSAPGAFVFKDAHLAIYDVAGRRVKQLAAGFQPPGTKTAVWNGRNDSGQQVTTGVYLYRQRAGAFVTTRKMVLLKSALKPESSRFHMV